MSKPHAKTCVICSKSYLPGKSNSSPLCHDCRYVPCVICGTPTKVTLKRRQSNIPVYCSRKCMAKGFEVPRITKTCEYCGKEFSGTPGSYVATQKYCSLECMGLASVKYRTCKVCGKEYTWKDGHRGKEYCSPECFHVSTRGKAYNKKVPIEKVCPICSKTFYVIPARGGKARYCSRDCQHRAKELVTGTNHPLYKKIERTCEWCGEKFLIIPARIGYGEGRFCSRRCQGAALAHSQDGRRSSIELLIEEALNDFRINYIPQKGIGFYIVDFYLPDWNLVIECDGDYWHNLPEVIEKDKRKNDFLTRRGYEIRRYWESDIRKNSTLIIENLLAEFRGLTE